MAPRSWAGTFVGYKAKNQWRIFDRKNFYVRCDIIFNESNLTYLKPTKEPRLISQQVGDDIVDLASLS